MNWLSVQSCSLIISNVQHAKYLTVVFFFYFLLFQAVRKHYLTKRWLLRIITERVRNDSNTLGYIDYLVTLTA